MTGFRNYGPDVSQTPSEVTSGGEFSGADRNYLNVIIQEDQPIIDWEMNLRSQIKSDYGLRSSNQTLRTSCFLGGDFLERADVNGSFVFLSAAGGNENKFQMRAVNVNVNGWIFPVDFTAQTSSGLNEIELTAPPGAGSRVDLVILEVWLALIKAAPSADNKSSTSLILRHGNVKAPDAVNLADDLVDPNFGAESSARVQVQYRLRVVEDVNLAGFPDGLDDPFVVAHTVSDFGGAGADGSATALPFSVVSEDKGLWRAGAGDSADATTLGTVDGYMYAVPVCAVYRRNTTAFDRTANPNGAALIAAGTSDRPDGLFADQVVASDVVDLRRGCAGDLGEIMGKAFQQVMDNTMTTTPELSDIGTGGTSFLYLDEIGISGHIGDPDGVRRYFTDRTVTETIVAESVVGGLPQTTVVFELSALKLPWNAGTVNLLLLAPADVRIAAMLQLRRTDGSTYDYDVLDPGNAGGVYATSVVYDVNVGPGVDRVTVTLNASVSSESMFAELAIEYPIDSGLSRNVVGEVALWGPSAGLPAWVDSTGWTATSDATRLEIPAGGQEWYVDEGHREIAIRLLTTSQSDTYVTSATDELYIPERLDGSAITITDGTNAPYATTDYTVNTAFTVVQLTGGVPIAAGTAVGVDYVALRPPPSGSSFTAFYESRAVQSIEPPAGTQTLNLTPRGGGTKVTVIANGPGSPDDSFPFVAPGDQIPIGSLPIADYPEARLDGPADVELQDFNVNTGFLQLPAFVEYLPNPGQVTLFRDAPDIVEDAEGRFFWPKSDDGLSTVYSPTVFAQHLTYGRRHKVSVPVLMELKEDVLSIGKAGTLILVVLTSWSEYDPENRVALVPDTSDSAAAVFRVRGRMLSPRRPDY